MKIQEAIQKAVEGGWLSEIAPNIEYANGDFSGGIRHGYCELGFKQEGTNQNTSYQRASIGTILLDPLFWSSLGKSMGWEFQVETRAFTPEYDVTAKVPEWLYHWHSLIDHLAEGKSIEDYFANLK